MNIFNLASIVFKIKAFTLYFYIVLFWACAVGLVQQPPKIKKKIKAQKCIVLQHFSGQGTVILTCNITKEPHHSYQAR